MSEPFPQQHGPVEPSAADLDPSLHAGDPTGTIAEFSEQQRKEIADRMVPGGSGVSEGNMVLEDGETLESQCNANYKYLNERGMTMSQFAGTLLDFQERCRTKQVINGVERVAHSETVSGRLFNPITGEYSPNSRNQISVREKPGENNGALSLGLGPTDVEVATAQVGIFGAREQYDLPGSCRAEQILKRLEATETGRAALASQGVGDQQPKQPIALLEEPEIPAKLSPEEENLPATQKLEQTLNELMDNVPAKGVPGIRREAYKLLHGAGKAQTLDIDGGTVVDKYGDKETITYRVTLTQPKNGEPAYTLSKVRDVQTPGRVGGKLRTLYNLEWEAGKPSEDTEYAQNVRPRQVISSEIVSANTVAEIQTEISEVVATKLAEAQNTRKRGLGRVAFKFGRK